MKFKAQGNKGGSRGVQGGQQTPPPLFFCCQLLKILGTFLQKGVKLADLRGKLSQIFPGPPPFEFSGSAPAVDVGDLDRRIAVSLWIYEHALVTVGLTIVMRRGRVAFRKRVRGCCA